MVSSILPQLPCKYDTLITVPGEIEHTFATMYYIHTDHLGSYIALTNAKREVVQRNCFNPWGNFAFDYHKVVIKDAGDTLPGLTFPLTRRGFTGHEHYPEFKIINMNGRLYDPVICRFFSPDNFVQIPEFTQSFNRYSYCLNNPLKYVDPSGERWVDVDDIWEIDEEGRIINRIKDKTQDAFYMVAKDADGKYQRTYTIDSEGNKIYNSISFPYGTIESQRSISFSPDGETIDTYDVYKVRGDANGTNLFDFLSDNITKGRFSVELSQAMTGIEGAKGLNFITTGHESRRESGMGNLLKGQLLHGYTIRELNHSHPISPIPSNADMLFKSQVTNILNNQRLHIPDFNLYHVPSKRKIPY
jgi:RHS repeat-associated protein